MSPWTMIGNMLKDSLKLTAEVQLMHTLQASMNSELRDLDRRQIRLEAKFDMMMNYARPPGSSGPPLIEG